MMGGRRGGWCRRRVNVVNSSPLNASIRRRPSASTTSISRRMSLAVWRFSSLKTSADAGDGFVDSVPGNRAGKDEGGVAVAKRRKLRVVEREGLKYCSIALFGRELKEDS